VNNKSAVLGSSALFMNAFMCWTIIADSGIYEIFRNYHGDQAEVNEHYQGPYTFKNFIAADS